MEAILNLTTVNTGKKVDVWAVFRDLLGKEELVLELDPRLPDLSVMNLRMALLECKVALTNAVEIIYTKAPFEVLIIGAEIDEDSESLWVWLDNPENPLQDRD